jgi:hypothetical protein
MTSCPAGRFCSPVDFNAQLANWLAVVNTRAWRALRCAAVDRIAADKPVMLILPPVARPDDWVAVLHPAGARSLHPAGFHQRLGTSQHDRPPRRDHRRPRPSPGPLRANSSPTTIGSGCDTRQCPTRTTSPPPRRCAATGQAYLEARGGRSPDPFAEFTARCGDSSELREALEELRYPVRQLARGDSQQVQAAQRVLTEARRSLYLILAETPTPEDEAASSDRARLADPGGPHRARHRVVCHRQQVLVQAQEHVDVGDPPDGATTVAASVDQCSHQLTPPDHASRAAPSTTHGDGGQRAPQGDPRAAHL